MKKLWKRFRFIAAIHKFIPFLKDFFLSKEVLLSTKLWSLALVGLYVIVPFDIIPDFLPLVGLVDDVSVFVVILQYIVKLAPPTLREKYGM